VRQISILPWQERDATVEKWLHEEVVSVSDAMQSAHSRCNPLPSRDCEGAVFGTCQDHIAVRDGPERAIGSSGEYGLSTVS